MQTAMGNLSNLLGIHADKWVDCAWTPPLVIHAEPAH